jgi:hypothetical protein
MHTSGHTIFARKNRDNGVNGTVSKRNLVAIRTLNEAIPRLQLKAAMQIRTSEVGLSDMAHASSSDEKGPIYR